MRFQRKESTLEYVSAVDVQTQLYHWRDAHFFTPIPLVLGMGQLKPQKIRVERVAVQPKSVLLMFTDGLKSRTNLKGELEMLRQPSIAILSVFCGHNPVRMMMRLCASSALPVSTCLSSLAYSKRF